MFNLAAKVNNFFVTTNSPHQKITLKQRRELRVKSGEKRASAFRAIGFNLVSSLHSSNLVQGERKPSLLEFAEPPPRFNEVTLHSSL